MGIFDGVPDAIVGEQPGCRRRDLDGKSAKQAAVAGEGGAERPAVPSERQDLLEPRHLGDSGVGLNAGLKRIPDQRAHQPITGLEPKHRVLTSRQAEAGDLENVGPGWRRQSAEVCKQAAEEMRPGGGQ